MMPTSNQSLTAEQRSAAIEWLASAEKLNHFLRGTPGYPELAQGEIVHMFDVVESALFDLRRVLEASSVSN